MALANILKDFNVFVESKGFAGKADETELPSLEWDTEEFSSGGMNGSVEVPLKLKAMVSKIKFSEFDPDVMRLFGVTTGKKPSFRIKGSITKIASGGSDPVEVQMRGIIKASSPGTWKSGEGAKHEVTIAVDYYKYTQAGRVIHEIDVLNMKFIVDGVDQLAQTRTNLGID